MSNLFDFGDLADIYQEVVVDHSRSPRNAGALDQPTGHSEGYNPLCGDRIRVDVDCRDGRLEDIRFEGSGCAICTASASMMTEHVKGCAVDDVVAAFHQFHQLVAGAEENDDDVDTDALDKLIVFAGVRRYPARVKCATLPWHTLKSAVEGSDETVSTE